MNTFVYSLLWPPAWALVSLGIARLTRMTWHRAVGYAAFWGAMQAAGGLVLNIWQGNWPATAASTGNLIILAALWWWHRKDRRRAVAAIGAKSKALRDALVRKAREVAIPRPVLVPGGAS